MRYSGVNIKGTGSYLPAKILTNEDITRNIDTTSEWILNKLGINERRIVVDETTHEMGFNAAIKALSSANLSINDIDLIVVATSSPEQISPSTACVIHSMFMPEKNIPAFDINAVCSGFVYAINLITPLVYHGVYNNVLVIATEAYSKSTDWGDRHSVFFGDGAGAIVLGKTNGGWISCDLNADGRDTGMTGFVMPKDGVFKMNGPEVWAQAIKVLPDTIRAVLKKSDTNLEDIKLIIPHQPSINILKVVANDLGISMDKVKTIMHKYANIAGASIPIALDEVINNNEINYGDTIVLSAIGSGWTWGSTVINYEK